MGINAFNAGWARNPDHQAARDEAAADYAAQVFNSLKGARLKSYEESNGKEIYDDLGEIWDHTFHPGFEQRDDAFSMLQQCMSLSAVSVSLPAGDDRDQADKAVGALFRMAIEKMADELSETETERFIAAEEREARDY